MLATFSSPVHDPHTRVEGVADDGDTLYVAYTYPYTYTDLQLYLRKLEADPVRRNRFRRRVLCTTLAGNDCDLITITSFAADAAAMAARKGVVISARVHPGECNASWMMQGFIDYLTGPSLDAKILRDNFVFKIVPMLNPDGVIVGNYRCSLAGVDLNRWWKSPSRKLHPTVWHTKEVKRGGAGRSSGPVMAMRELHVCACTDTKRFLHTRPHSPTADPSPV